MTAKKKVEELRNEWPLIRREDGIRMEIICPHGVGHPSKILSGPRWISWMDTHGCDGCCSLAAFALAEVAHAAVLGIEYPVVDARQQRWTDCTDCQIHCWAPPGATCACGGVRVIPSSRLQRCPPHIFDRDGEIGRASCRERV